MFSFLTELDGWPVGLIPIAIHTEWRPVDHVSDFLDLLPGEPSLFQIGNPDANCPRWDAIWDMAHCAPEYQAENNNPMVIQFRKS